MSQEKVKQQGGEAGTLDHVLRANRTWAAAQSRGEWSRTVNDLESEGDVFGFDIGFGADEEELAAARLAEKEWGQLYACYYKEVEARKARSGESAASIIAAESAAADRLGTAARESCDRLLASDPGPQPGFIASTIGSLFETFGEIGGAVTGGAAGAVEATTAPIRQRVASFFGFGDGQSFGDRSAGIFRLMIALSLAAAAIYLGVSLVSWWYGQIQSNLASATTAIGAAIPELALGDG